MEQLMTATSNSAEVRFSCVLNEETLVLLLGTATADNFELQLRVSRETRDRFVEFCRFNDLPRSVQNFNEGRCAWALLEGERLEAHVQCEDGVSLPNDGLTLDDIQRGLNVAAVQSPMAVLRFIAACEDDDSRDAFATEDAWQIIQCALFNGLNF